MKRGGDGIDNFLREFSTNVCSRPITFPYQTWPVYFIGHLTFFSLLFLSISSSLFGTIHQRATKRREIRDINFINPVNGGWKSRWNVKESRRSYVATTGISLVVRSRGTRGGNLFNISTDTSVARIAYAINRIKNEIAFTYFRNCSVSLCNLDTRIYSSSPPSCIPPRNSRTHAY